jgi:putative sugar O-methyltransferase
MSQRDEGSLDAMLEEVRTSPPEFRPSRFWDWLIRENLKQLKDPGLEYFKSTVNQNYYNWIPLNSGDNQVRNLLRHWSSRPAIEPLQAVVEGSIRLQHLMEVDPLGDPKRRSLYALFVGLLWHYASQHDPYGVLNRLSEPQIGHPIRITLDGRMVSQDLANSAREFTAIVDHLSALDGNRQMRVAELGAGYGRVAYVFSECRPCQYWIFDIPPALYIAQWYLSQALPGKTMFFFRHFDNYEEVRAEIDAADVCFFTPNQLALVPDGSVDAFLSICSLQEMTLESIRMYLQLMARKTHDLVYLKQWTSWRNPVDQLVIKKHMYTLGPKWNVALDREDAVQDLFFETIFRKGMSPMGLLRSLRRQIGARLADACRSSGAWLRAKRRRRTRAPVSQGS